MPPGGYFRQALIADVTDGASASAILPHPEPILRAASADGQHLRCPSCLSGVSR